MIETLNHGILDVSEDISRGQVILTENQLASLNLVLVNHRRKYDGVFTPNDIVHVDLKRVAWLPTMTGFLNNVPFFSVFPRSCVLSASCSLKRIKHRPWDPGAEASVGLLNSVSGNAIGQVDGGLRDKVIAVLTTVAQWPQEKIHIGQIPNNWMEKMQPLYEKLAEQLNMDPNYIGGSGVVNGSNLAAEGLMNLDSVGPATGTLPAHRGSVGVLFTSDSFSLTFPERGGPGSIGSFTGPTDPWYLQMRWPYYKDTEERDTPQSRYLSQAEISAAKRWWKNRRILVVNPNNNKGVVLRAVEWGPSKSDLSASLSTEAMSALGLKGGQVAEFRFAQDGAPLGPFSAPVVAPVANTVGIELPEVDALGALGFRGSGGLQPHANAAGRFIEANWNTRGVSKTKVVRRIAGTNSASDHSTGHAIDAMVTNSGARAEGRELAVGNAIALWFAANPNVFGTRQVIWNDRINSGNGWRPYRNATGILSNNTLQHRDHVHVGVVKAGAPVQPGPMGSGWVGSTAADFNNVVDTSGGFNFDSVYSGLAGPGGLPLLNAFDWHPVSDITSELLAGPRALMNDVPILESVGQLLVASQRSYMAAPNGDLIAWFPDYFGIYGTASKILIRDIELINEGFTVNWGDDRLVTHQFTAGSYIGTAFGLTPGGEINVDNQVNTMGIANIEMTEMMEALFNVDGSHPLAKLFRDPEQFLQRFGARPNYRPMNIITGPQAEFWYAVSLFQRTWASQFSSRVELTFMPEVWPGMLLVLESLGVQVYVSAVEHTFDFSENGGFTTSATVIAPSTTKRGGLYGLPLAGSVEDKEVTIGRSRSGNRVL